MTTPTQSLRHRTFVGLLWSGVGNYGASAVRLVTILALGWLLPPSDFGLLALAFMFVLLAEGIGELGMVSALVQQREPGADDLNSAFWLNLTIHVLLGAATFLWARPITSFLGDTSAAPLLRLLSTVFLINALAVVPRAVLIKNMRFRQISVAQLAGEVAFATVGLSMAALGYGFWSLGAAVIAQRTVNTLILWTSVRWRPALSVDFSALRRLVRFGGPMMGGTLLERALVNVDYFVIGRFIGTEELGYYSLAYQLAMVPLDRLVGLTRRVTFSAFSEVQDAPRRLASGVVEGTRHLFNIALPVVLSIVVLGPWLLEAVYGAKWSDSIVSLRILGLGGLFLIPRVAEAALLAIGRPRLRLWLLALRFAVFVTLAATVGIHLGINGIAACVSAALAVWAVTTLSVGIRMLELPWRRVASTLGPATRAGLLALVPLIPLVLVPRERLSPWAALVYAGVTMSAVYGLLMLPTYRESIRASWRSRPPWLLSSGTRKGAGEGKPS